MEVSFEQFAAVEERVEKIEGKLDSQWDVLGQINEKLKKLDTIEIGLFGNERLGVIGVIKNQAELQGQINVLKDEIEGLKKVNEQQDVAIQAKRGLTDNFELWARRIVWTLICLIGGILLITGKIGIVDLWK